MPIRTPSLQNDTLIGINREIGSQYDNVKVVAENIDDVAIVAGATATTQIVADNISNVTSVANAVVPNIAEILLADDNAATATAMASTATTQAGLADTARIAAETARGIAETKASEAAASAVAADASADLAAASAGTASTKASDASASAAAAHNSELAAAAILDTFDDRYLGAFASNPTADNDGNALTSGALYFNTTIHNLRVYDAGLVDWIALSVVTLAGLQDVNLTNAATGDVLRYNGTVWTNGQIAGSTVVNTPAGNIASTTVQAAINELDTEKASIAAVTAHTGNVSNPHSVTKAQIGLSNVDNTADSAKAVLTATKLATPRTINGVSFDGTANITVNAVDSIARIASSEKGVANGVATLDGSGLVPSNQLPSYVDDVLEYSTFAGFPATGAAGKIYVDLATNKTYRWSGSAYVYITSGAVDSVAGKTGIVTLAKADVGLSNVDNTSDSSKNVLSATKWTTGRTITIGATGKTVDGSGNVSWSLAEIGAQASGNYQPLDATLTALAGVTAAADKVIYATGVDTFGTSTLSAFGRTLIDDADATTARSTLGVVIGTNVQAYDAGLLSIAGLTTAADKMIYTTASDVYATATLTAAGRALIDDVDAAAQRTTLDINAANTPSTAVGGISATNVQAAIAELDTEKVAKSVVVTSAITSVTFNADGTITIVTP